MVFEQRGGRANADSRALDDTIRRGDGHSSRVLTASKCQHFSATAVAWGQRKG